VILSTEKRKIVVMPQYLSITTTMHGLSMYWKWKIEMDIVCTGNGNSMYFVLFESFEG
jgi:hypothetical protein